MKVRTDRFGELEVSGDEVLTFPRGLFGFEDVDRYVLIRHRQGSPFRWLQAVDRPELAFVVAEPLVLCPEYRFDLSDEEYSALECAPGTPLEVLVVVGIPEDPRQMTANLKGPILINPEKRVARQVILPGDEFATRFRVVDAVLGRRPGTEDQGGTRECW